MPNAHRPVIDTLAGLVARAHSALTGIGPDDHHAQSHTHAADGSGTVAYSSLSGTPTLGGLLRPLRAGWYLPPPCTTVAQLATVAQMRMHPLVLTQPQTLDQLIIETTVAGSATAVTRLGVYASAANGQPGALLLDAGTVDSTVTPAVLTKGITLALAAGVYWLAAVTQGAPATGPTYRCNSGVLPGIQGETAAVAMFGSLNGYYQNSVTGALPDPAVPAAALTTSIRVIVRISA
jgi:hypothetical protein